MQALASDSSPRLDLYGYRRYRLQKFARVLKTMPGVFFEEHLKQSNYWLRDSFKLFER